eukprot:2372011-Alexandrium_andersonii.AAC.1
MSLGKTAWCHFAAAAKSQPRPRALGHAGILASHWAFDRALRTSLSRHLAQRQGSHYRATGGAGAGQGEAAMLEVLDGRICTACAAHDCHNGLKWGLSWLAGN